MAIGGGAKPGQWMQVQDSRLVCGRTETTMVTESDLLAAIERLMAGERVCVDVYRQNHIDVQRTVRVRLANRRSHEEHALANAGSLE